MDVERDHFAEADRHVSEGERIVARLPPPAEAAKIIANTILPIQDYVRRQYFKMKQKAAF